jgi:hypothetical protein
MMLDHETQRLLAHEAGTPSPRKEVHVTQQTTTSGMPLAHATLSMAPKHIPNDDGYVVKTELVLERSPQRTVKVNWWWLPDAVGGRKRPHNHPWAFDSEVLHGWIHERRYTPRGDGTHAVTGLLHKAGETYHMGADAFHVVTDVGAGTVTRMTCGEARAENEWGYLAIDTWEYTRALPDPQFMRNLVAVNPHLAKDYVVEFSGHGSGFIREPGAVPTTRADATELARTWIGKACTIGGKARVVHGPTGDIVWPNAQ